VPRPPALTDEVERTIVDALLGGNYLNVAAAYANISDTTLYRWLNDDRPRYRRFREAISRARAQAEVRATAKLQELIVGGIVKRRSVTTAPDGTRTVEEERSLPDGKAIGFYLERAHPERWGRRQALEISGPQGGPVQVLDVAGIASRVAGAIEARREDEALLGPVPERVLPPADDGILDAEIVEDEGDG